MLKLIVAPKAALRQYVSREFWFIIDDLETSFGWRLLEPEEIYGDRRSLREIFEDRFGAPPSVILFWESFRVIAARAPELSKLGSRIAVWADDLHSFDDYTRLGRIAAFVLAEKIFAAHANRFAYHYPFIDKKDGLIWLPHAASPDFAVDFNEAPERSIFLGGAVNEHYPLRERLKVLGESGGVPVRVLDHPGYHCGFDYGNERCVGNRYAREISRHFAAFTDGSANHYLVAKFFEIPATGALLLADDRMCSAFAQFGFEDGVHYVSANADNMEQRIREVLDPSHSMTMDGIRRAGRKLIEAAHLTRHRARQIEEAF